MGLTGVVVYETGTRVGVALWPVEGVSLPRINTGGGVGGAGGGHRASAMTGPDHRSGGLTGPDHRSGGLVLVWVPRAYSMLLHLGLGKVSTRNMVVAAGGGWGGGRISGGGGGVDARVEGEGVVCVRHGEDLAGKKRKRG